MNKIDLNALLRRYKFIYNRRNISKKGKGIYTKLVLPDRDIFIKTRTNISSKQFRNAFSLVYRQLPKDPIERTMNYNDIIHKLFIGALSVYKNILDIQLDDSKLKEKYITIDKKELFVFILL